MNSTSPPYRGRRVLIVEDDNDAGDLLTSHLHRLGCSVLRARTGDDCLRLLLTEQVELAIVDLVLMGGMTGWEVIESLRNGSEPRCAVAVSSVLDPREYPRGIDGVLPKPVTRASVEELLDGVWVRSGRG